MNSRLTHDILGLSGAALSGIAVKHDVAFARRMVHHGRDRVQISAWKSHDHIANLVPFPEREALSADAVAHASKAVREQGFTSTYTAALTPAQAEPFLVAGFDLVEELHLLRRVFDGEPPSERAGLRRGRRSDFDDVLALDVLAFDDFWQFDRSSLTDAMRATPRHRFQVARTTPVHGYHVTGLAGSNAYVQRVAVHPDAQGQGWGTRLVNDSLRWAWRNGATMSHVNTQITNHRAVALYERCGFISASYRLQVLHSTLD